MAKLTSGIITVDSKGKDFNIHSQGFINVFSIKLENDTNYSKPLNKQLC